MLDEKKLSDARDLLTFIDASPSPYHAIKEVLSRLGEFTPLDERQHWRLEPGSLAYVVRGGGSLVAFRVGQSSPADAGFLLLGAHTDSPNLRVKPQPNISTQGYHQLAVETYGGLLLHTWLDRDLSLAGRVSLRNSAPAIVRFSDPVCRIPSLAIHLDRELNSRGLQLNAQTHGLPVIGLAQPDQNFAFLDVLAEQVGTALNRSVSPEDISGFDLCLFDTQPSTIGGKDNEFIFAPRLDNLASCHAALRALLESSPTQATQVIALWDHEEVGSQSAIGARSQFLHSTLSRILETFGESGEQSIARAFARSLLVSADMAHAVHPNYAERHDKQHRPKLGNGPVIKKNANQSYATDGPSAAVFVEACREVGVTPQRFVSRNDMPCGSTIGPISAARLGIRTLDVGNPMLSMHSCRELAATADVTPMIAVLRTFLSNADLPDPAW